MHFIELAVRSKEDSVCTCRLSDVSAVGVADGVVVRWGAGVLHSAMKQEVCGG